MPLRVEETRKGRDKERVRERERERKRERDVEWSGKGGRRMMGGELERACYCRISVYFRFMC